jgi:hypothetical protein
MFISLVASSAVTYASPQQMMAIVQKQKQLDQQLNGCTNICVVGASGNLPGFGSAQGDRTRQNAIARHYLGQ